MDDGGALISRRIEVGAFDAFQMIVSAGRSFAR
jgi:hypothetical protein